MMCNSRRSGGTSARSVELILALPCLLCLFGCRSLSDKLIEQLRDDDPRIRRAAARDLSHYRDNTNVVAALTRAIDDPDLEVRELAITSLGEIGSGARSSVPALEQALEGPPSERLAAAYAIRRIDPQNRMYEPVLLGALRSGNGPVFLEVGRMGADGAWAVPTLRALLLDRRPTIRALSAQTLGQIGPAANDADAALRARLDDPDQVVRKAAESALPRITSDP